MRADIVIIGSGISGLTAAAILARNGREVIVVEKNNRVGGALKQFKRQGTPFDVGFHYTGCLGDGQILHKLWSYCDALQHISILPFPDYGSDRLYIKNSKRTIDAYFSYKLQADELKSLFPREKNGIDTYFTTIASICDTIPFYTPSLSLSNYLRGYRSSATSVQDFIVSLTSDPVLQAVLASPSLLYGISTDNTSIDVHAMVAHGYYQGAYSIAGGGQSIVDGFTASCKQHGVVFKKGQAVETIHFDSDGITGVTTSRQEQIDCKKVIYTGHPTQLLDLIDPSAFRPAYRKRLLALKNTFSMNVVFGIIDTAPPSLQWNNHIYLPGGPNPFAKKFNHFSERILMLTSTARESNTLQQQTKSVILLQPARWDEIKMFEGSSRKNRPAKYVAYKEKMCNSMINRAEMFSIDGISKIQPLTTSSPLTFRDELSAPEGCAYGASHSLDQYTPDIRTRLPGMYLSGQSTLMTGVAGASLAGFVTAGHILGLDQLWQDLNQ